MIETNRSWNFPSNNHGEKTGISEAGIETFKGELFTSLAREICQNSMDAQYKEEQAVHIEFQVTMVNRHKILGIDSLADAIQRCCVFWEEEHDKKAIQFFEKAQSIIEQEEISILRISDFNTNGVTGSKDLQNSPWQNLVKSSGVSNKSGDSGGSFGIGKSAPYAVSHLRTIFYSTLDRDGVRAYQGVSKLATFLDDQKETTQGKGYFGVKENNLPILEEQFPFGDYTRDEMGTDIFVVGFQENEGWVDEILKAVIDGYLISIATGNLTVKVADHLLNQDSIKDYLEKYKEKLSLAYQYYQVLTDVTIPWMEFEIDGLPHIQLKIGTGVGYGRKILMARSNGMKIFDQNRLSTFFEFAGICILHGSVNANFRAMENPQHTKWEPDRYSDDTKTKKVAQGWKKSLISRLKEEVRKLSEADTSSEMDAKGVGEFIPALDEEDQGKGNQNEDITDQVKGNTTLETVKYKQKIKGSQNILEEEQGEQLSEANDEDSGEEGWGGDMEEPISGGENGGSKNLSTECPPDYQGTTGANKAKILSFLPLPVRMFLKDAATQRYSLSFTPHQSVKNGKIALYIVGEQGRSAAILESALDFNSQALPIQGNKIVVGSLTENQKFSCYFSLNTKEQFSMEVEVNGYQV